MNETAEFNDKYFPRVDLSNKNRYLYYKHNNNEYAYDKKTSELITLFKDSNEGKDAPYRVLASIGFNYMNWLDKETRDEYLEEYEFETDMQNSELVDDFIKNELPLYQDKKESRESECTEELQLRLENIACKNFNIGQSVTCTLDEGPDGKHSYKGTVTKVFPDHIILDIDGISDHCWYDDDMADSIAIEDRDPKTGKEILNEVEDEYYIDTNGIMGVPNETYTVSDLTNYWKSEYISKDPDPVIMAYGGSYKDWLDDTLKAMDGPYYKDSEELELRNELIERYSFPLVDQAIEHFYSDLGETPDVDDVIGYIERLYPEEAPEDPEAYGKWYNGIACEISARLNEDYNINFNDVMDIDDDEEQINKYIQNLPNGPVLWRLFKERVNLPFKSYKVTDLPSASVGMLVDELNKMPLLVSKNAKVSMVPYSSKDYVINIRWKENICEAISVDKSNKSNDKKFLVKYINRDDRSAEDIVYAVNEIDAKKQVKPRAYRILSIKEIND